MQKFIYSRNSFIKYFTVFSSCQLWLVHLQLHVITFGILGQGTFLILLSWMVLTFKMLFNLCNLAADCILLDCMLLYSVLLCMYYSPLTATCHSHHRYICHGIILHNLSIVVYQRPFHVNCHHVNAINFVMSQLLLFVVYHLMIDSVFPLVYSTSS